VKVCIGQINTTPGDFPGNFEQIKTGLREAGERKADVIVYPELSLCGYLSQDLMYHPTYVKKNLEYLDKVRDFAMAINPELVVIVGYIDRARGDAGKPFANMAAVIRQGKIEDTYQKQLLPFYDVFDEARYFQAGDQLSVFEIEGEKIGITICEDLWNDKDSDDYNYASNPLNQYRAAGVKTIISLNSSPYIQGKLWNRLRLIGESSLDDMTIIYVNQYGGQDELVFDGQSFIVRNGDLIYLNQNQPGQMFDLVDTSSQAPILKRIMNEENRQPVSELACSLREMLVLCLRDYTTKSGFSELVLASSGGVDSAVVCSLAVDAVGAENVHGIRMPSRYSSDHSKSDALQLHQSLGCWDYTVPIEHQPMVEMLNEQYGEHSARLDNLVSRRLSEGKYNSIADENIQARLRDLYIMHFSNAFGAMPLSTGNKTESACGYYTHFDMNFSFAPIKDLYKFQVMSLASEDDRIPENIWKKPPSAELSADQFDEDSLLPYAVLDAIVMAHIEDYVSTADDFNDWVSRNEGICKISSNMNILNQWLQASHAEKDYGRIIRLMGLMEYKRRQTCPGTKVSKVAFGIGRRIPVVEKWS
jgi:NAD+ synthetase